MYKDNPKFVVDVDMCRCSEVALNYKKSENGTPKWWSLQAGGHYSEVVVSSGLTVFVLPVLEMNSSKVKPVSHDYPQDPKNVVFVMRWSLFGNHF